jgi:hypothetical protein
MALSTDLIKELNLKKFGLKIHPNERSNEEKYSLVFAINFRPCWRAFFSSFSIVIKFF